MMRVLAITFTPVTVSNPFPKLELSNSGAWDIYPKLRPPGLRSDCSDSPRGSCSQRFGSHRLGGDWLDRTGLRRLLGYRKTDQNPGAPSRSLTINRTLPDISNSGPIADSVAGAILGITANLKPATEQGNALPHARKSKRIFPSQRLLDSKPDSVVLNGQSHPSIGRTHRNVYAFGGGVLGDVVTALLDQP